jgi:hypothetical protein
MNLNKYPLLKKLTDDGGEIKVEVNEFDPEEQAELDAEGFEPAKKMSGRASIPHRFVWLSAEGDTEDEVLENLEYRVMSFNDGNL